MDWNNGDTYGVPKHLYHHQHNISPEYLHEAGQWEQDLVKTCVIDNSTDKFPPCMNRLSVPVVSWKGYPNMCFTMESLWGLPDAQPRSIHYLGRMVVVLQLHPEQYVDHNEAVQAYVLVHDPRALDNPIREGISLMPGKIYNIFVSQAHESSRWTDILPVVLLGIRTAVKGDIGASCAEIAYGMTLKLPCDMIDTSKTQFGNEEFVNQLRTAMRDLNPVATSAHGSTVTERLPAPFRTNCTDYLKLWRENGGRGPLTRKSCAEKCKMVRSLQRFRCVPQSISYPNNSSICGNIITSGKSVDDVDGDESDNVDQDDDDGGDVDKSLKCTSFN
ncbi:hypothetical protein JTE90_004670 [Oedothorax gibbosus]|uniref:Uncharacterized protein n=1 Tax=Oedothorax gibbosus TaxID=931172 RepID=A0AAV6U9N0_9ARAC|nr:hypothetical protein JTE90_004670 [Oedothorax gibbosus]